MGESLVKQKLDQKLKEQNMIFFKISKYSRYI